jgi:hypothetical protein
VWNEGDSLTTTQFQKEEVVKKGGVAKIVEVALIVERVQSEERLLGINNRGRFGRTSPALFSDDHGRDDRI